MLMFVHSGLESMGQEIQSHSRFWRRWVQADALRGRGSDRDSNPAEAQRGMDWQVGTLSPPLKLIGVTPLDSLKLTIVTQQIFTTLGHTCDRIILFLGPFLFCANGNIKILFFCLFSSFNSDLREFVYQKWRMFL